MDIVVTLGTGSKWQDNELRYALRSVQQYLQGWYNIVVVGECPEWLQNVKHIPSADVSQYNKEKNIFEKICAACELEELTDNFMFMNDDHFFCHGYDIYELPNYHREELEPAYKLKPAGDTYRIALKNTDMALKKARKNTLHYDVHTPIIYNRHNFLQLRHLYNWAVPYGYVIKSLYANTFEHRARQYYVDTKLNAPYDYQTIAEKVITPGRMVWSIGDRALNADMKRFIDEQYPTKSRWEK